MFALNLRSSLQGKDLGDDSVGEATALQVIPAHFTWCVVNAVTVLLCGTLHAADVWMWVHHSWKCRLQLAHVWVSQGPLESTRAGMCTSTVKQSDSPIDNMCKKNNEHWSVWCPPIVWASQPSLQWTPSQLNSTTERKDEKNAFIYSELMHLILRQILVDRATCNIDFHDLLCHSESGSLLQAWGWGGEWYFHIPTGYVAAHCNEWRLK